MKKLKMKTLKTVIWLIIVFWAGAAFMEVAAFPSLFKSFEGPVPLESVDFSGDIEGLYVKGTLYGIYDCYCQESEDDDIIGCEYIIDAGDYHYMGLRAEKKDIAAADALMKASWDYLDGVSEYSQLESYQYEITGTITAIPSKTLGFYEEYRDYVSEDETAKESFLPYYLTINKIGRYTLGSAIGLVVVGAILFLLGCLLLFWALSGHYQKSIKKYISSSSNPEYTRERVEYFLENTPTVDGLQYNNEYICGYQNGTTAFGEMSKLAWVYLHTTTHKRNFITVGTTYCLMLCFADGSIHAAEVKNEDIAKEHMQKLSELCPKCIFGYTDELDKLFRKDLNAFLNLRYNAKADNP